MTRDLFEYVSALELVAVYPFVCIGLVHRV